MNAHVNPTEVINYTPPPVLKHFIKDHRPGELFYDWIVGPVGSGKTTGIFFKLVYMAKLQAKGPDGIRRSRAVVVRNTAPQLRDTTLTSWNYWFKNGIAGEWRETDKKFTLKFGDVECEVLFRPLDTPDDVARVLSLEVTFAILDEFVQIPREIVDALSARLGRYPSAKDGGATNWGMWGSSNPSTEDNWWYEYLHSNPSVYEVKFPNNEDAQRAYEKMKYGDNFDGSRFVAKYFKQPSGFAEDAENVENLPGKRAYYENQAKGKSEEWIKQFLECEWGYSVAGKPVVPTFRTDLHVAKKPLLFNPLLDLVIGLDPGVSHSAMIFGQMDLHGTVHILGELVQQGYGAERLIREVLKPYMLRRFPDANVVIAPDPAAANRSQTDERTIVQVFRKYFPVKVESNNQLSLRLDAIEHFTTKLVQGHAAILIDPHQCPILLRALKGGWRYEMDPKGQITKPMPDKRNPYSHPGDAFGYLCRYFHRGVERETTGAKKFTPPRSFGANYHMR
jgi:hypothetical protein